MEKVKSYKSFLNEADNIDQEQTPNINQPGPERKFSKENKYKFQLPYEKKIADKLNDYNFTFYKPEGEKEGDQNFIIIDILNLTYSIITDENQDIRTIDASKLKHIMENL